MWKAIAEAYQVDEVKDIRDKAVAMEVYFRQAHNTEAERQACEIRLRAERHAGELLTEMEKAKGGQPYRSTSHSARPVESLSDLGISKNQSSRWQKLADVPQPELETALAAGIITASRADGRAERTWRASPTTIAGPSWR